MHGCVLAHARAQVQYTPPLVVPVGSSDAHLKSLEPTSYKCSNPDVGSTEQELINVFEHKIYTFYINYK